MNVVCVSTCILGWTFLYAWLCYMLPYKSCEWNCRLVTVIHAVFIMTIAGWSMFIQGPNPLVDTVSILGGPNTTLHNMVCVICMSYFIYDLAWCVLFQTEAAMMLFHHILSIYGTSFVMYRGMNGAEMMLTICGSELTNPFLQLRWFLRETNHHKTWYSELNIVAFVLLFTVTRVGIGTWFITIYMQHPRPDLSAKLGSVMFYLVSMLFWFHIVRYALKHFKTVYCEWGATQEKTNDDERIPSVPLSSDTLAWSATEPDADDGLALLAPKSSSTILANGVDKKTIDCGETECKTDDKVILSAPQSSDTMLVNSIVTEAEHSAALH